MLSKRMAYGLTAHGAKCLAASTPHTIFHTSDLGIDLRTIRALQNRGLVKNVKRLKRGATYKLTDNGKRVRLALKSLPSRAYHILTT